MNKASKAINDKRREFLQQLGLGSSAAAFFLPSSLLLPRISYAQPDISNPEVACKPPGTQGTAVQWRADCRPIQSRRPASTLSAAEVQKLRDAYKAMRDLATSDPLDPRGFWHQANVHCWNCSVPANQQHGSWRFFTWHRAMLYFHERILGHLVNDENLRLPYWDWELTAHRSLPAPYATPGNATNPLWNGTRNDPITLNDVVIGQTAWENALNLASYTEFLGTAGSRGSPEGQPHGHPHVRVGGDMGAFDTAARDPIFFTHHGNLDRLWSEWNKASATHTNPTDAAFLNLTFSFYNESKQWMSIKASQVLDHETSLRYRYGPSIFLERIRCILVWRPIRFPWATLKKVPMDARMAASLDVPNKAVRVRLHLSGLELPMTKTAEYNLYASAKEAADDSGPDAEGFLGSVAVVLPSAKHVHGAERRNSLDIFDVTQKVAALTRRQQALELYLVETPSKAPRVVIPVRARDVFFTKGEVS